MGPSILMSSAKLIRCTCCIGSNGLMPAADDDDADEGEDDEDDVEEDDVADRPAGELLFDGGKIAVW